MTGVLRDAGNEGRTEPTREDVFHLLSNRRRRHTLHYLRQRDGEQVDLRELSQQLSAWENGVPPAEITHRDRKTVYTSLRQTHLPKMDDANVVDYDPNRGHVEPAEEFEDVEVYLDVVPEQEIPRSEYYLGLSAFAAALLAVAWVDVFPFDLLSDVTWAAVIVALFAVSAAVDTYYDARRQLGSDGAPPDLPEQD
ncbi:DUF7344 domain-containing protein [Salarchaeum japonicum]|uniref:DUF7344 domain-containing protein n=1 Tax=Salarchaeum japonicum TaxID=555573 RepID=A0AAV3T1P0_9EURY|nr:hypothetical protein [Salarchaeum japonicum]